MNNVKNLNQEKVFTKEAELIGRITGLICEYDGELSLVAVIGILELKKQELIFDNDQ